MNVSLSARSLGDRSLQVLWEDGERALCRGWDEEGDGAGTAVLAVRPISEHPTPGLLDRLAHEYGLRDEVAGPRFGNYEAGFRFGRLGHDLVEKRGLHRFQARTYMSFGNLVMPWTRHVQSGRDLVRRAFEAANKIGDLTFAAYSCNNLNTNLLAAGDPLSEAQREIENGLDFARRARFGLVIDIITAQLGLVRTLRGLTPGFGSLNDQQFDESRFERHLASDPRLALPECWYWVRKLQARFFAGDFAAAVAASSHAERLLWTSPSFFEVAEYHFYSALSRAASFDSAMPDQRRQHFEALAAHHKQLEVWAEHCPENFENRAALVRAEIDRLEGRDLDAMLSYERAVRSARENGFVQNEALSNELAGRFYLDRGLETNGYANLRNARACYTVWGADGKVRQLERLHPRLTAPEGPRPAASVDSSVQQLDVTTVVKASQAVSSEIVMAKLVETLMTIALENAGADRGLLILPREDGYCVEAEARASGDKVEVMLSQAPITADTSPEALLRYVIRTRQSVILEDSSRPNLFSEDEYLRDRRPKSVLCLPLARQGALTGLLYLENTLTSQAFTPARITVLEVLAAQAAISLETTRLYSDLQEREAKVRRLVDSNIIGICIWDVEGRIIEANEAFLHMLAYDREDLVSGRLRWRELTPAQCRDADERAVTELRATGSCGPFEKEYFRKDGVRVPVLVGAATYGGHQDQGVAFVLDLTERKRTEEELRGSEQRHRETQMALAHANRVTTMGHLTASIAHEVNQPIAAVVTNAHAALRWLGARRPDLDEVRQALDHIIKDGNRASDVIGRIRGLINKVPPRDDPLDINQAILDATALTRSELVRHRIALQIELAQELPVVQGDRIQLQQVLLNLIINAVEAMSVVNEGPRELLISSASNAVDNVLVAVRDSGPGLTPESFDRLFQAFQTTKPDGMGMGLSICRSIVEAHGGRVWAVANAPRGAIFQFTLPARRESPS